MGHIKYNSVFYLIVVLFASACATMQPPNAAGPRANEEPYPVIFSSDDSRRDATIATVTRLLGADRIPTPPQLQPITATIGGLNFDSATPLYLPKLGAGAVMTEEETRESLRRFIRLWQAPIGADPAKLSLVERVDQPDGSKIARYEQRAFRYPLRGNYGKLEIRFGSDRRVLNIMSTCIPDADKIQTGLTAIAVKIKAEDAVNQLLAADVSSTSSTGSKLSFHPTAANEPQPQELVTFVTPSDSAQPGLVFHLAWQINLTKAPVKSVYLDAVSGEVIGTEPA
ncbi:MAG TPA: hypothetical protein VJT50_00095 [Pyrinomonadaceae bacterium]|nr:hypothetical protein [Pyrinomonadaceae bacterium]